MDSVAGRDLANGEPGERDAHDARERGYERPFILTDPSIDLEEVNDLVSPDAVVLVACRMSTAARLLLSSETTAEDSGSVTTDTALLEIRPTEQLVTWCGQPLNLTGQEIGILGCLADGPGRACSFKELINRVWESSYGIDATMIHSAIWRLRRKLSDIGDRIIIESVRGYGFRLKAATGTTIRIALLCGAARVACTIARSPAPPHVWQITIRWVYLILGLPRPRGWPVLADRTAWDGPSSRWQKDCGATPALLPGYQANRRA